MFSKIKLCLFGRKKFLYIENDLSTSTDVIGAYLNEANSFGEYSFSKSFSKFYSRSKILEICLIV